MRSFQDICVYDFVLPGDIQLGRRKHIGQVFVILLNLCSLCLTIVQDNANDTRLAGLDFLVYCLRTVVGISKDMLTAKYFCTNTASFCDT